MSAALSERTLLHACTWSWLSTHCAGHSPSRSRAGRVHIGHSPCSARARRAAYRRNTTTPAARCHSCLSMVHHALWPSTSASICQGTSGLLGVKTHVSRSFSVVAFKKRIDPTRVCWTCSGQCRDEASAAASPLGAPSASLGGAPPAWSRRVAASPPCGGRGLPPASVRWWQAPRSWPSRLSFCCPLASILPLLLLCHPLASTRASPPAASPPAAPPIMGKTYLRYDPADTFGVIASSAGGARAVLLPASTALARSVGARAVVAAAPAIDTVLLWQVRHGTVLRRLADPAARATAGVVTALAVSADGRLLAAGHADGSVRLYSTALGGGGCRPRRRGRRRRRWWRVDGGTAADDIQRPPGGRIGARFCAAARCG